MSVGSGVPYNPHVGNGVSTVFSYGFTLLDAADLVVTVDGVVTSAYTVSGVGIAAGGAVTFSSAPANGAAVLLQRVIQLVRSTEYPTNGDLLADTVNNDFDRLWMAVQNTYADGVRSLRVPEVGMLPALPAAAARAGLLLGFDSSGDPVAVAPASGSAAALALDLASSAAASKGAGQLGYASTLAYGANTVGEYLNRFRLITGGGGVSDDRARLQAAIDALTAGQVLICRGVFRTVNEVFVKASNITLDLHAATFQFDAQTGYGGGIVVGDPVAPSTMPQNVAILGGKMTVAGGGVAYPGADWNPIAVLTGRDVRIIGATIYPKSSTRALSIQTDSTYGSGGVAIDNVVFDVTIIGDGNATDGVDISSDGRDGLIGKVTGKARVSGCKRGVNVSPGNDAYTYTGLDIDVEVHGATELAGNFSRIKSSRLKVRAVGCTKGGITTRQLIDCDAEFQVIGSGGALTNAYEIVDGATIGSTRYRLSAVGPWVAGVIPNQHDAIYETVEVDGATVGIDTSGFRSTWGLVTLKNCTTPVDDLNAGTDAWGIVTQHNTGSSPRVIRQSMAASAGAARYAIDLHGEDTITLAPAATAQPFGASSAFGGLLVVHGLSGTGDQGLFQVANGLTKLVSDTGTTYSAASGTGSRINVYLSGGIVTIQNNLVGSVTLRVRADRMRNSA